MDETSAQEDADRLLWLHRLAESIDSYEKWHREHLSCAFSSPYLGHYDLPKQHADALRAYRRVFRSRPFVGIERMFKRWPALTCILFARCVAAKMGANTGLEIYPHLAALVGVPEIPPNKREDLSLWFRSACQTLGIPVLHRTGHTQDNIREYLLQAGVPFTQIEDAAHAFARTEASEGLPDPDDDATCALWSGEAADRVHPGLARLRFVLQEDANGYYASLWVRARTEPHALGDDGFGNRLVEAAARLDAEIKHAIRPPRLAWCGDGIAVVVPAERGVIWHIDLNGAVRTLRATDDEAELPFSLPWPARIPWQRRGADGPSADGHLSLAAAIHGGVTVFDVRTGRLAAQVSARPAAPLRLASGHYVFVSSQQLHHADDAGFDLVGGGFALDIVLETEEIRVRAGNCDVILVPWQRPAVELRGESFTDLKGTTLHASHGLQALVRWPQEEAGVPHELIVEAGALTLRHSLPVRAGDDRTGRVDLGRLLDQHARVVRLILRVVRAGEQRAVARTTALVWCGLDRVLADRKFQGSVPENFSRDLSTHIIVGGDGLSLARDIPCATATAVFADIDGHGSNQTVIIPQPEPYALIEWIGEDGARQQKPLRNGETIIVAPGSERSLLVFCADSTASLRAGSREEPRAFARSPCRRLPLAALNDLCQGEASSVSLVQREPYELTLLGLPVALLCTPSHWRFSPQGMAFRLDLAFERPAAALRLDGEDILTGRSVHLELLPDGLNVRDEGEWATARLEQRHDAAGHDYQLAIDRTAWPDGAWLLSLHVRFEESSRWQRLQTMRQDVYALGLCLRDGDPWHKLASGVPQETELDVFGRCHSALLLCYAPECWKEIKPLEALWRDLVRRLSERALSSRELGRVLLVYAEQPPLDANETWVPLLSYWHVMPQLMSLPGSCYGVFLNSDRSDLRLLAQLAVAERAGRIVDFYRIASPCLSSCFLHHFDNLAHVDSGQAHDLAGFDLGAYTREPITAGLLNAYARTWSERDGILSAAHHAWCWQRFADAAGRAMSGGGHQQRLPAAMAIAAAAGRWMNHVGRQHVTHLIPTLRDGTGCWWLKPSTSDEASDGILEEAPKLLSVLAFVCRAECRHPGLLKRFLSAISAMESDRLPSHLGLITFLGADLFAFYLLTWELLVTGDQCRT